MSLTWTELLPGFDATTGGVLRPEERLMVAVFSLACADLRLAVYGPEGGRRRGAARAWFDSDAEAWPLSFVGICGHFGIDPGAARAAVLGSGHRPAAPTNRPPTDAQWG